jgi:surface antigen
MSFCMSRLLAPLAAVYVAFGLVFGIFARPALADAPLSPPLPLSPMSAAPSAAAQGDGPQLGFQAGITPNTFADLKSDLDQTDRLAVLEAIHVGLSDAPDGATYMWRRHNGKIMGSVKPTMSFRDIEGKICRYIVFQLLLGEHLRQVEGIACRQDDKSWLLEG